MSTHVIMCLLWPKITIMLVMSSYFRQVVFIFRKYNTTFYRVVSIPDLKIWIAPLVLNGRRKLRKCSVACFFLAMHRVSAPSVRLIPGPYAGHRSTKRRNSMADIGGFGPVYPHVMADPKLLILKEFEHETGCFVPLVSS